MGCSVNTIRQEGTIKLTENGRRARLSRGFSLNRRGFCRSSSGGKVVAMMQTAKTWHGYNLAT
jgi:hypothetical protein